MVSVVNLIKLLGRTDRSDGVSAALSKLNAEQPLQRPSKNEDEVNVLVDQLGLELCFKLAEKLPVLRDDLMEGELVLLWP